MEMIPAPPNDGHRAAGCRPGEGAGSSEPAQRLQRRRGHAEPRAEARPLASQQQRSFPLTFEPERGDPLANVVAIESFPLDA